jgi:hypothetical protein
MNPLLKILITVFLTGFSLNLVWEILQTWFFFDFPGGQPELFILIHLKATAADAAYTVLIYLLVMTLTKSRRWLYHLTFLRTSVTLLTGFLIGETIEKRALEMGLWSYGHLMPIIPYLQVGLMPVLQMMVLPLAAFFISRKILSLDYHQRARQAVSHGRNS